MSKKIKLSPLTQIQMSIQELPTEQLQEVVNFGRVLLKTRTPVAVARRRGPNKPKPVVTTVDAAAPTYVPQPGEQV